MAEVLLIERSDIVKYTPLDGNVDTDKFIQFVKIAQDIHIQGYLGTDLLNKLKTEIEAGTLANPYLSLLSSYIKPMLIHWAMVEYLPYAAYTVANKGVFKHTAESSTDVTKSEIDFLVEKQRITAENYSQRFVDYMSFNQASFPEYNTNSGADVYPKHNSNIGGWYL